MHRLFRLVAAAAFLAVPSIAQVAPPPLAFGQQSKDAPWVPTPDRMVRRMLQMAETKKGDVVLDLGAGDGRILIHAVKHFGSRAIGVELEENLVKLAREAARREGVADRVRIIQQDLFDADLSTATVIFLYVGPGAMKRLKPRLLQLAPGTRIVSHQFDLGDWDADEKIEVEGRRGYMWVVPAAVDGTWDVAVAGDVFRLQLTSHHQKLSGSSESGGRKVALVDARMRGAEIRFNAPDRNGIPRQYAGRLQGDRLAGESHDRGGANPLAWGATRRAN
jgi:SAM-dependent methyltransferase